MATRGKARLGAAEAAPLADTVTIAAIANADPNAIAFMDAM